jgi:hypothetical protein
MDLEARAKRWLKENKLLKDAYRPPIEAGFGWSPGELEEAKEQYENDTKYNENLIAKLTSLLYDIGG